MNRRHMLAGLAAASVATKPLSALAAGTTGPQGPRFAVTIDDFNLTSGPLMAGLARNRAVLDALDAANIKAAGFIAGKYVDNAAGQHHLAAWAEAGHLLGNHTYRHAWHGGATPPDLGPDIDRAAPLISSFATARPLFRFPYLAEGRTPETRDRMRADLRERGLSNAHVTIDASDWYVDQRMRERMEREPDVAVAPYGEFLGRHLLDRAGFYDGLAREVLGYSPPHTVLIHHTLATALFLPRVLQMFAAAGWTAIDAEEAFAHPIYQSQPDIAPAGNSLIWQLAQADGRFAAKLRSPGEDGPYEKPAMDALGL